MMSGEWLGLLDARSFPSVWFWILVALAWGQAGRAVLGVPMDVIARARRAARAPAPRPVLPEELQLLDWLSLTLPNWRATRIEATWLAGLAGFALTVLLTLGFGFGLQFAQALSFLAVPFALLTALRLILARRLIPLIEAAQSARLTETEAAARALRLIMRHRHVFTTLSMLSVAATAMWGVRWLALHPFGS